MALAQTLAHAAADDRQHIVNDMVSSFHRTCLDRALAMQDKARWHYEIPEAREPSRGTDSHVEAVLLSFRARITQMGFTVTTMLVAPVPSFAHVSIMGGCRGNRAITAYASWPTGTIPSRGLTHGTTADLEDQQEAPMESNLLGQVSQSPRLASTSGDAGQNVWHRLEARDAQWQRQFDCMLQKLDSLTATSQHQEEALSCRLEQYIRQQVEALDARLQQKIESMQEQFGTLSTAVQCQEASIGNSMTNQQVELLRTIQVLLQTQIQRSTETDVREQINSMRQELHTMDERLRMLDDGVVKQADLQQFATCICQRMGEMETRLGSLDEVEAALNGFTHVHQELTAQSASMQHRDESTHALISSMHQTMQASAGIVSSVHAAVGDLRQRIQAVELQLEPCDDAASWVDISPNTARNAEAEYTLIHSAGNSCQESEGSASSARSAWTHALSTPDLLLGPQCFLLDCEFHGGAMGLVKASSLHPQMELSSASLDSQESLHSVTVKTARVLPERERDIVSLSVMFNGNLMVGKMTSSQEVLALKYSSSSLCRIAVSDVCCSDKVGVALASDGQLHMAEVAECRSSPECCQVVEVQLHDASRPALLSLGADSYLAVFGCPPPPTAFAVISNSFVSVTQGKVAQRSNRSDPLHERQPPRKIYRTIAPPHDETCRRKCRFHFNGKGCKSGKLCPRCHHNDHR